MSLEYLIKAERKKEKEIRVHWVILKGHRNQSDTLFTGQDQDSLGIMELLNKLKHFAHV